jgi:hypothetical protein
LALVVVAAVAVVVVAVVVGLHFADEAYLSVLDCSFDQNLDP